MAKIYYESQLCWAELPRLLNEVKYSNIRGEERLGGSQIQPQPAFRVAHFARDHIFLYSDFFSKKLPNFG